MKGKASSIGFRGRVMLLAALALVCCVLAGTAMYATGKEVLSEPTLLMVSHTEYRFNESGQIIARLVDFQGNPVDVTSCNATILYPDKTVFFLNQGMVNSTIAGDHYYNFTTPVGPEGVYEYQATCYYAPNKNASVTNSFHLSGALNSILGNVSSLSNLSTEFAVVNSKLDYLNVTVTNMTAVLSAINITTTNTYTYLTTTLAADIDDILAQLGIINATVNRIEANTVQINDTVTEILDNQENEVRIDVFSG